MKICMVTDTFWPRINGVSVSISTLTRALRTLGHEVHIAAPDYEHLPTRRKFIDGDRSPLEGVIRFPSHAVLFFPEDSMVRFLSPEYVRQQNRIRGLQFDVIHTHTPLVLGILAMYWHPIKRVPLIHTYHTLFEDFMPFYFPLCYLPPRVARTFAHWLSMNVFHWYCNNFDRVVAPSHQVADILCNYYLRCPVDVVPTGIEIERFQNGDGQRIRDEWRIGPQEKLLLFTGRVCFEKNVELLVRTMPYILRREPLVRLAIVGQGPAESTLKRLANELGIASHVHFAGYRPYTEMADIYAAGDLFLFASQTETQGLVTVEAMASGTPVVAVRGPGTLDVLKKETGGLLCAPDEADLANQVVRLLQDPALYVQKTGEARKRADDFSSLTMARRMLQVYESVL
jgi:1,2-diacylglycerol 3-alpha-glucosyltransferase